MAKTARRLATGSRKTAPKAASGVDLSKLDRDELLQLQKDVEAALRTYQKRKRDEVLSEMQKVAERHGLALKDVMQGGPKRSVQVPKYKHPENRALTWSGRGRQPDWFKEALGAGHSRDDLLIA
jgi:DNA-binding protein H-NS